MQNAPVSSSEVEKAIKRFCPQLKDKGPVPKDFNLAKVPGGLGSCNHIAIIVDVATAKGVFEDMTWTADKRVERREEKRDPPNIARLVKELTTAGALENFFNGRK